MVINASELNSKLNSGKVTSIRGSVVDVWFNSHLPAINTSLLTGKDQLIKMEVFTELDAHHVRAITLTPTQGLARGTSVTSIGTELSVPIGKEILGRMFDVFGNTIDHLEPLSDMKW